MNELETGPSVDAKIVSSVRITPQDTDEIRKIVLQIDEPSFRYREGQSIAVVVPGPHPFGNQTHLRRYTIADDLGNETGNAEFSILVRRCSYIDEVSGEEYPGIASNYLCDLNPGAQILLSGPFKSPFKVPVDSGDNIVMISSGTGIAPFRSFIQKIYQERGHWLGQLRIFYGAKSGMDLLYMNDQDKDLANYYDETTFKAYSYLANRPLENESDALTRTIEDNAREIWSLLEKSNTHVYIAGLKQVAEIFDQKLAEQAPSDSAWAEMKLQLKQENRLSELIYH
jgi:ferredoxin--NADP+ reductase